MLVLVSSGTATAACWATNPGSYDVNFAVTAYPPVGGVMARTDGHPYTYSGCTYGIRLQLHPFDLYDPTHQVFYDLANPSVGVRITAAGRTMTSYSQNVTGIPTSGSLTVSYELVRLRPGPFTERSGIRVALFDPTFGADIPPGSDPRLFVHTAVMPEVRPTTCELGNIAPPLNTIRAADLPSVGSVATANAGFLLPMTCRDGTDPGTVTMRFVLRDALASGSTADTLTVNPASSTSSGVALQMLRKDASGTYVLQNMGATWTQTKTQTGPMVPVDLAVRYIRTGAVAAGTLNSQATVTLDYP